VGITDLDTVFPILQSCLFDVYHECMPVNGSDFRLIIHLTIDRRHYFMINSQPLFKDHEMASMDYATHLNLSPVAGGLDGSLSECAC